MTGDGSLGPRLRISSSQQQHGKYQDTASYSLQSWMGRGEKGETDWNEGGGKGWKKTQSFQQWPPSPSFGVLNVIIIWAEMDLLGRSNGSGRRRRTKPQQPKQTLHWRIGALALQQAVSSKFVLTRREREREREREEREGEGAEREGRREGGIRREG